MMAKLKILSLSILVVIAYTASGQKSTADSALHFFRIRSGVSYCSPEWQIYIDSALRIDSTVATLWQWKGMPYFKNGDYAEAMRCYDKMVMYSPETYLSIQAFMKLTFLKDNEGALKDFIECKKKKNYGVGLMDHSYEFFMAIAYKEMQQFEIADSFLQLSIREVVKRQGDNWVNFNEWFFAGIIAMERHQDSNALIYFDKCLREYPGFPNAVHYKAVILARQGKKEEARHLFLLAIANIKKGMRSAEDNDSYVNYPNQVFVPDVERAMKELL